MSAPLIPPACIADADAIAEGHNRYRVAICEWAVLEIWIDAPSEDDAIDKAMEIRADEGEEAFKCSNTGIDGGEVIDCIMRDEVQP